MRNLITTANNFDRLFNQFETDWLALTPRWPKTYSDLTESGTENTFNFSSEMKYDNEKSQWVLTAEMAGVTKESLKLDAKEDHLYISGEKTKGLGSGKFEKIYRIPQGCDVEKIEAEFTDGVLTLMLPLQEKKTVKSIQFK